MSVKVTGIYMAAGASRRMGVPKLSIPLGIKGKMGGLALKEALSSRLERIFVVSRCEGYPEWLTSVDGEMGLLSDSAGDKEREGRCCFVTATRADLGMALSLRAGLAAAVEQEEAPDAVVVLLADQPLIHASMIDRLIAEFEADRTLDYVASGDGGTAKPPMLLASSMFEAVRQLEGDEGARKLLNKPDFHGKVMEETDRSRFIDLDTPQDVEGFLAGQL